MDKKDIIINHNNYICSKNKELHNMELLERHSSKIEYIDSEETNHSLIAMNGSYLSDNNIYSHCEIQPSTIFGAMTTTIPLSNHNQAPRVVFYNSQGKQAIGVYSSNFQYRIDTMSYVYHYPQKPLLTTRYVNYIGNNNLPNGENLIVAIATYTGYNQEDSLIINKSSIERGSLNLSYYKSFVDVEEENHYEGEKIIFYNPTELIKEDHHIDGMKFAYYGKIDKHGFPKNEEVLGDDDIFIGKGLMSTKYIEDDDDKDNIFKTKRKQITFRDKSILAAKKYQGSKIDRVVVYKNKKGLREVKIRFRKIRVPELGDKMGSRHGQKGTVGMIIPQENMPFTKNGIVPDLIVNPHAFPSRMTIGQFLETVIGKTASLSGHYIDGTPFQNFNVEEYSNILQNEYGFERHANEIMYNGLTGEQMGTDIFIGPTYYHRLKHMVSDKFHSREEGPRVTRTMQPTPGRGRDGGLRIGEMERDAILSHGVSQFLKESMMERSDYYVTHINKRTGKIIGPSVSKTNKGYIFENNNYTNRDDDEISEVHMPYSFKLLLQEIKAMNVNVHLVVDED